MTTTNKPINISSTRSNDALIDQLRACQSSEEILNFEKILALFQYLIIMMNENYLNYNLRKLMFKRTLLI